MTCMLVSEHVYQELLKFNPLSTDTALYFDTLQYLTLSRRWSLSYRNQSIDLFYKSVDWFLYDKDLRHERVKQYQLQNLESVEIRQHWAQNKLTRAILERKTSV